MVRKPKERITVLPPKELREFMGAQQNKEDRSINAQWVRAGYALMFLVKEYGENGATDRINAMKEMVEEVSKQENQSA